MNSIFNIVLLVIAVSGIRVGLSQTSDERIERFLHENRIKLELEEQDIRDVEIYDRHYSTKEELEFIYIRQTVNGIGVYNSSGTFVASDEELILSGDRLIRGMYSKSIDENILVDKLKAITLAANKLYKNITLEGQIERTIDGDTFSAPHISQTTIKPIKVYYQKEAELRLCWNFNIKSINRDHWWDVCVDTETGELLVINDWAQKCRLNDPQHNHCDHKEIHANTQLMPPSQIGGAPVYNVFALPVESPNFGGRSLVVDPADSVASPFGWHDIDGNSGNDFTSTRGNNVYAMEDEDGMNGNGYSSDGTSSLLFDFNYNPMGEPDSSMDASITNLFYMNNVIHDITYHYGFDEIAGNFQKNNYTNGGLDEDQVMADALDGAWFNNAIFMTPPEGSSPRMEMYTWEAKVEEFLTILSPNVIAGSYVSYESKFGNPVPLNPISSELILLVDGQGNAHDACEDPVNLNELNGNIAVIVKGGCMFTDKVLRAQNAGAIAAIVINTANSWMFSMGGTDPAITIPSILVDYNIGQELLSRLESGEQIFASLESEDISEDGSYDNVVIAHEYGHGISSRLTGGASNVNCLQNQEQMGEGWSDWLGLTLTIESGDNGTDARPLGTYVMGDSSTGAGVRPAPYSTDFQINNYTYGSTNDINNLSAPHGTGFVWATILWDITWALIDKYGFDSDLYNGSGGNNIAMQLIITGMKIQPCSPGFVDGRDAILQADQLLYNGANQCLLWNAFANRGLGYSADQGSSDSRVDQIEAFDLPPSYNVPPTTINVASCDSYLWPETGIMYLQSGTYSNVLTSVSGCDSVITLNLQINESFESTEEVEACKEYVWPVNGTIYTESGLFTESYTTVNGCDSTYNLELTITDFDVNVEYLNATSLFAENISSGGQINYSWYDCGLDEIIVGQNNQIFSPVNNGSYAVIVDMDGCYDTTNCYIINSLGLEDDKLETVLVYPNPTKGNIHIDLNNFYDHIKVDVSTIQGQILSSREFRNLEEIDLLIEGSAGQYLIIVHVPDGGKKIFKIIKE